MIVEKERVYADFPSLLAGWLDAVDLMGEQIPVQTLTQETLPHPLSFKETDPATHMINAQLGVIVEEFLSDGKYFDPAAIDRLRAHLGQTKKTLGESASIAVNKLAEHQTGFLEKGESWQFAKVGLEVSPASQRTAYKLHSLQELIAPYAKEESLLNDQGVRDEDVIADEFTKLILGQADRYKIIANAIGPYRFSVRWNDFLEGGGKPERYKWIQDVLENVFPQDKKQEIPEILLDIAVADSNVTPGTTIQLLEKKTFRSKTTGEGPDARPLTTRDVEDPHMHDKKVEFYLLLSGPGMLKVQFNGENVVHTITPDPNLIPKIDLTQIGAVVLDGIPTLVYNGNQYKAENGARFITLPLDNGTFAQFEVVRPGDIHDFQNVGISPASAYALTLGFSEKPGDSLVRDYTLTGFANK